MLQRCWYVRGECVFLQGILFPTYGSNTALWSIGYEFWTYLVGALLILAVFDRSRLSLVSAVSAVLLAGTLNSKMLPYLAAWLLGVAVSAMVPTLNRFGSRIPALVVPARLAAAFLTIAALLVARFLADHSLLASIAVAAIPTAMLLAALAARPQTSSEDRNLAWASRLANSSYSLYAIHVPLLVFFAAALGIQADLRLRSTVGGWLGVLAFVAVTIIIAHIFASYTESRTQEVRRLIGRVRSQSPGPAHARRRFVLRVGTKVAFQHAEATESCAAKQMTQQKDLG